MKEFPEILKELKPLLVDKFNVKKIGVFGSCVTGDLSRESDIDVLVEFSGPIGWELFDLKDILENAFQRPVDLVTVNALKSQLRDTILKEVVYV